MAIKNKKFTYRKSKKRSNTKLKSCAKRSKRRSRKSSAKRSKRRSRKSGVKRSKCRSRKSGAKQSKHRSRKSNAKQSKRRSCKSGVERSKRKNYGFNVNTSEDKMLLTNLLQNSTSKSLSNQFVKANLVQKNNNTFSKIINLNLPKITDQKNSGRCWIYAFLNTFRPNFIKKFNLPSDFEFSTNYLFFYHKLERAYYFLDNIKQFFESSYQNPEYYQDRTYQYLLQDPISDGGRSNMLAKLVSTYGIVPTSIYRNTIHSNNTHNLDNVLLQNLKSYSEEIFKRISSQNDSVDSYITQCKSNIKHLLEILLGQPPESSENFTFDYYEKEDKNLQSRKSIITNPIQFATEHQFGINYNHTEYITCVNYPGIPYNTFYNIKYCENDPEFPSKCLNLPIQDLIKSVERSIDANCPVWFACDVGQYYYKKEGILDQDIFDMTVISSLDQEIKQLNFSNQTDIDNFKSKILKQQLSLPVHAMTIIGYDKDQKDQSIVKFKIENSWGENKKQENNGYLTMSTNWFKLFVFEIYVKKEFLDKTIDSFEDKEASPWGLISCSFMK